MPDDLPTDSDGLTRRNLLAGLAGAGAAAGLFAAFPTTVLGAPLAPGEVPEALGPTQPALTYAQLDAYAFFSADTADPHPTRLVDTLTGANPIPTPGTLVAPLPIPCGSVIKEINVSYLGQPNGPGVFVFRRPLNNPRAEEALVNVTLPGHIGSDPRAETVPVDVTIPDGVAATLRFTCAAGVSVFAATVGYLPPKQGFVPLNPPVRALDTRTTGGKLQADEERTIDLGIPAGSRGAVINLTITETDGTFGFVSVFRADIAFPGNSSINWSSINQTSANAVITAVDAQGRIKIRGSVNSTHVVIDTIGALQ